MKSLIQRALILIVGITSILTITGCTSIQKEMVYQKAEPFLREYDLQNDSTYLCADLFGEKQDCPDGLLEKDFGVPYTQGFLVMRVCFGFTNTGVAIPDGMECFVRNFIQDSTVYTDLNETQ